MSRDIPNPETSPGKFTPQQRDAYERFCAAIRRTHYGIAAAHIANAVNMHADELAAAMVAHAVAQAGVTVRQDIGTVAPGSTVVGYRADTIG